VQVYDTGNIYAKNNILTANHHLTYFHQQQQWITDTLQENAALYTSGSMVFNNIPLKDALQRIASRFGYSLKLHPKLNAEDRKISGCIRSNHRINSCS